MKKEKIRQWHEEKKQEAETKIRVVLSDQKLHQYGDLLKETKISKATLSKHLKEMEKKGSVCREMDTKNGKYPHPVYYRINIKTKDILENKLNHLYSTFQKEIEEMLSVEKIEDPEAVIRAVSEANTQMLLLILNEIKERKKKGKSDFYSLKIAENMINFMTSLFRRYSLEVIEKAVSSTERLF